MAATAASLSMSHAQLFGAAVTGVSLIALGAVTVRMQSTTSKQFSYLYLFMLATTVVSYVLHYCNVSSLTTPNSNNFNEPTAVNESYWPSTTPILSVYLLLMAAIYNNKNFVSFFTGLLLAESIVSPLETTFLLHPTTTMYIWIQYVQCNLVMALCLFQLFDASRVKMIATYMYVTVSCVLAAVTELNETNLFLYQALCWLPILAWAIHGIIHSERHRKIEVEMSTSVTLAVVLSASLIVLVIVLRTIFSSLEFAANTNIDQAGELDISATGVWMDVLIDLIAKTSIGVLLLTNEEVVTFMGQAFLQDSSELTEDSDLLEKSTDFEEIVILIPATHNATNDTTLSQPLLTSA